MKQPACGSKLDRAESAAQEVEVRFEIDPDGTRVELEHRHWERLGDEAEAVHSKYLPGWDYVLGHYVQRIASAQRSSVA